MFLSDYILTKVAVDKTEARARRGFEVLIAGKACITYCLIEQRDRRGIVDSSAVCFTETEADEGTLLHRQAHARNCSIVGLQHVKDARCAPLRGQALGDDSAQTRICAPLFLSRDRRQLTL